MARREFEIEIDKQEFIKFIKKLVLILIVVSISGAGYFAYSKSQVGQAIKANPQTKILQVQEEKKEKPKSTSKKSKTKVDTANDINVIKETKKPSQPSTKKPSKKPTPKPTPPPTPAGITCASAYAQQKELAKQGKASGVVELGNGRCKLIIY